MISLLVRLSLLQFFLLSGTAQATQEHGEPEGLVTHELGHLFFILSMAYLYISIKGNREKISETIFFLSRAALNFLIWNMITFTTHLLRIRVPDDSFQGFYFEADSLTSAIWYAGNVTEHFFIVFACYYFLRAVRSIIKSTEQGASL